LLGIDRRDVLSPKLEKACEPAKLTLILLNHLTGSRMPSKKMIDQKPFFRKRFQKPAASDFNVRFGRSRITCGVISEAQQHDSRSQANVPNQAVR
jgi:hypothetical protein